MLNHINKSNPSKINLVTDTSKKLRKSVNCRQISLSKNKEKIKKLKKKKSLPSIFMSNLATQYKKLQQQQQRKSLKSYFRFLKSNK